MRQTKSAAQILKAQLFIQNNLNRDLSLHQVASHVCLSANHFHQLFKNIVGETLKCYTDRLRVEKSLYDIRISDLTLLEIASRYGFKNPETYSRTFKRHFGNNPSDWVSKSNQPNDSSLTNNGGSTLQGLRNSTETNFSITKLKTINLAFIRHMGDYHTVPLVSAAGQTPWRELEAFVNQHHLGTQDESHHQNLLYFGIPQDSPETTAVNKLRYDMAVKVNEAFIHRSHIGHQIIEAGYYGVLTHAGPYQTLSAAYQQLFTHASQLQLFSIAARPVFELLINITAKTQYDHTWTELYIPLSKDRL